jgi:hypothetical protein
LGHNCKVPLSSYAFSKLWFFSLIQHVSPLQAYFLPSTEMGKHQF